jgi:hypothetical protein
MRSKNHGDRRHEIRCEPLKPSAVAESADAMKSKAVGAQDENALAFLQEGIRGSFKLFDGFFQLGTNEEAPEKTAAAQSLQSHSGHAEVEKEDDEFGPQVDVLAVFLCPVD